MTEKNTNVDARPVGASSDMSSDSLESVELLADDFMRRQRSGEKPTIDEYCVKHPELADEIREVFPALVVIEQVAPVSADLDASNRSFTSPDAKPIESIGDYRVLREIGRGGMGVVYEAEQESLGRRVALKVLPRHVAKDEKSLLRFQREARAAARMHHTNIVPVFEVGHDNDYSFYAMQLIKGQGLDHVIDDLRDLRSQHIESGDERHDGDADRRERRADRGIAHSLITGHFAPEDFEDSASSVVDEATSLVNQQLPQQPFADSSPRPLPASDDPALIETVAQASGSTVSASLPGEGDVSTAENNRRAYFRSVAEIGLQAAHALAYAHARGITHRDIKPSNLILDTAGVVWITDFGLARTGDSSMTQTGDILGTIRYMSPERFKGQCDNRADVYSLGLTLYEMLVLKPAFESPDRLKLIDIVTKTEVTAPRSIDSRIPRDLETIILKACDKDPKRRYQSADEMADDIQRFVSDEPILARRASPVERVARWSRRNPWLATAMSVSAVALVAIAGISIAAAQTQATLNDQLTDANKELNNKTAEQRKTVQALADSNQSKETLIRDLKRSQMRLAEKQAEFVAEKGDLAQSMLWLARGYELAGSDDPKAASRQLSKLTRAATDMPKLVRQSPIENTKSEFALIKHVFRVRNPGGSDQPEIMEGAMQSQVVYRAFAGWRSGSVRSGNILALKTSRVVAGGERQDVVRCYDLTRGQWTGKRLACDGVLQTYDFSASRRWLATVSYKATANQPVEKDGDTDTIHATVERLTQVRHIDSGEVVWQDRASINSADNEKFVVRTMTEMKTRVGFSADGDTLIRISTQQKGDPDQFQIERISVESGDVSAFDFNAEMRAVASELHVVSLEVGRFGKQLLITGAEQRQTLKKKLDSSQFVGFDLESGKRTGEVVRFNHGEPLQLSASRVAVIVADSHRRRIQIHDVQTGEQVGSSYDLDVPTDADVHLKDTSPDGRWLVVASHRPVLLDRDAIIALSDERAAGPDSWVQIIDLTTRLPVTPKLPTIGRAVDSVLTTDNNLVVRDAADLRVWKLRGSTIDRTLMIGSAENSNPVVLALPFIQALPDGQLLVASRYALTDVTRWQSNTGRALERVTLPPSGDRVLAIDRTGKFMLTGVGTSVRVAGASIRAPSSPHFQDEFEIRSWSLDKPETAQLEMSLPAEHVPVALSANGRDVAIVVQPKLVAGNSQQPQCAIRVVNLKTQKFRDVPMPRKVFAPSFVDFDATGQRLFVISGPKAMLDKFDVSGATIQHVESIAITGFAPIPRLFPSVTFTNGSWALDGDGRLVAGYREDGTLMVQDLATGSVQHSISLPAEMSSMFAGPLPLSFDPKGRTLYFGRRGGYIFQTTLPQQWSGSPKQVYERLRTFAGLEFGAEDSVRVANLSEDDDWSGDGVDEARLEERELDTLELIVNSEWEASEKELRLWLARKPEDWIPSALLMKVLVETGQPEEAESEFAKFVRKVDRRTAAEWLEHLARWRTRLAVSGSDQSPDADELRKAIWFQSRQLQFTDGGQRVPILYRLAQTKELLFDLDGAAAAINEAVQLDPDGVALHRFRVRVLERYGRWKDAIESHRAVLRLAPDNNMAHFQLMVALLHLDDKAAFRDAWQAYRELRPGDLREEHGKKFDVITPRDLLAKPRLVLGGAKDESFELALEFADANYESATAMKSQLAGWYVLCKGLAEYRRGEPENLKEAIRLLDVEFPEVAGPRPNRFWPAEAHTRFVIAMCHHKLGETSKAQAAYLDGLDWHQRAGDVLRSSRRAGANDWQLAEVARRDAEQLLAVDLDQIDPPMTDTSEWQVVLEETFDKDITADWQQLDGQWTVAGGAASGTLESIKESTPGFARLEREVSGAPATCQIEYETWVSDPMVTACFLRQPPRKNPLGFLGQLANPAEQSRNIGLRVALASGSDPVLTKQGKPDTGINLLTHAAFGYWINKSVPEFTVEPGKHYKVRIIRQPQRITVFVDGKQVLSERVRNIETPNIRFFARGEAGTKMFVDNLRVKVPPAISKTD